MRKTRNIYMGENSTARMPVFGSVDTDYEIILNAISTGYDSLNDIMLTRRPGVFDKTTVQEINGRFGILRTLCRKYDPKTVGAVDKMHQVALDNHAGRLSDDQALVLLREISVKHGLNPLIFDEAMVRVNAAESMRCHPKSGSLNPLARMLPFWYQPSRVVKNNGRR